MIFYVHFSTLTSHSAQVHIFLTSIFIEIFIKWGFVQICIPYIHRIKVKWRSIVKHEILSPVVQSKKVKKKKDGEDNTYTTCSAGLNNHVFRTFV